MAARLGIIRVGEQSAREMATLSRAAIDRPLRSLAELSVSIAHDEARVLGTFQRGARLRGAPTLLVRGSGGPEVQVGVGTVHVLLALANPGALVDCDEKRIVNRSVRPLLRALNKTMGAAGPAHYFGRDWVSVAHVPAAWVGFAHDATTRRTAFEAFVSVRTPFAEPGVRRSAARSPARSNRLVDEPFRPRSWPNRLQRRMRPRSNRSRSTCRSPSMNESRVTRTPTRPGRRLARK